MSQRSWVRYPVWPHTFVSPSADSRGAVVSYWRKYVHEVLVNRLGGLSLPRKSMVRLTDRPDMTLDVYRGSKTTTQQQFNIFHVISNRNSLCLEFYTSKFYCCWFSCLHHRWNCSCIKKSRMIFAIFSKTVLTHEICQGFCTPADFWTFGFEQSGLTTACTVKKSVDFTVKYLASGCQFFYRLPVEHF